MDESSELCNGNKIYGKQDWKGEAFYITDAA